jgi:hypothetical protein
MEGRKRGDRKVLIKTASQQYTVRLKGGYRQWVELLVMQRWLFKGIDWEQAQGTVLAEVWRSGWHAKCPFCRGAMVVEPGEPFFCVDCAMQGNEFRPMRVVWPEERHTIERLLLKRPNPMNRNWFPHETVEILIAENHQHGIRG